LVKRKNISCHHKHLILDDKIDSSLSLWGL
jgi:hypothetical protein